ncbi:hypothetical protein EDB86DRAFT_2835033 [Lactarius hatsudake]|nr:hypothetical protein EDB86DRAFT_2835033 [Lactarius hatsudake]
MTTGGRVTSDLLWGAGALDLIKGGASGLVKGSASATVWVGALTFFLRLQGARFFCLGMWMKHGVALKVTDLSTEVYDLLGLHIPTAATHHGKLSMRLRTRGLGPGCLFGAGHIAHSERGEARSRKRCKKEVQLGRQSSISSSHTYCPHTPPHSSNLDALSGCKARASQEGSEDFRGPALYLVRTILCLSASSYQVIVTVLDRPFKAWCYRAMFCNTSSAVAL